MGYACVIDMGETEPAFRWEISAYSPPDLSNTNNRAELLAVTLVFAALNPEVSQGVQIVTDSMYTLNAATGRNVAHVNHDLVSHLRRMTEVYQAQWSHVRGHQGHPENELADQLCKEAVMLGQPDRGRQTTVCELKEIATGRLLLSSRQGLREFRFTDDEGHECVARAMLF